MRKRRTGKVDGRQCWGCARIVTGDAAQKVGGSIYCDRCLADREPCSVEGCDRMTHPKRRGVCWKCPIPAKPRKTAPERPRPARHPRTRSRRRRCHALGCRRALRAGEILMCPKHWRKLPAAIRARVHAARLRNGTTWKNAKAEWLAASAEAASFIFQRRQGAS